MTLYLIACVKQKAAAPCAARELYRSDWFRKARAYVEQQDAPWRILSAEFGLVRPDQVIAPYERTLLAMSASDRRTWGTRVAQQLVDDGFAHVDAVVFLAGRLYREPLAQWANGRATAPLARLGIGSQKAWLLAHTKAE